jgi:hypothetical protein
LDGDYGGSIAAAASAADKEAVVTAAGVGVHTAGDNLVVAPVETTTDQEASAADAAATAGTAEADVEAQVEALEGYIQHCHALLDAAETRKSAVTTEIISTRLMAFPAVDDPRALIAAVGSFL